ATGAGPARAVVGVGVRSCDFARRAFLHSMQPMTGKDTAGGGLRERKKRATRAALAEAAVRLAAEHGADHVTVEAISAAAGVSVRTFFNYFDSRDDAFVVIDADAAVRVRRALLEAPAELSPREP